MFGVIPINKPAGWTSRDVVNRIQGIVRPHKVGHTGTLDPMATGVLLLAIGHATRLVEFSLGHFKSYEADFQFGFSSDTLDTQGAVEALDNPAIPTRAQFERELTKWIGNVQQVPPRYSAINIGGRRAHDLARQGKAFELAARPIVIHSMECVLFDYPRFTLKIDCGSGTYVRSLGSDIARGLGTDAIMSRLVRTRVGPFKLNDCMQLDSIRTPRHVSDNLQPPLTLLANLPLFVLDAEQSTRIRHGIPLCLENCRAAVVAAVDEQQRLVAVLQQCLPHQTAPVLYRSLRVFQDASETTQPKTTRTPQSPES